eukprot:COSAG01_NODE_61373_length_290_cov_0.178010_1_plen_24_part_01
MKKRGRGGRASKAKRGGQRGVRVE